MKDGGNSYRVYSRPISDDIINDDCDEICFDTDLQNLQPTYLEYQINDLLQVQLENKGTVLVQGKHGPAGYITSSKAIQLIKCLKKGKKYKALILNISSTLCKVKIRALK